MSEGRPTIPDHLLTAESDDSTVIHDGDVVSGAVSASAESAELSTAPVTLAMGEGDLPPGTGLPDQRYLVTGRLGKGGGGVVFSVIDAYLEREIAVKVAHRAQHAEGSAASAYVAEARLTARLEHPNILPLLDLGFDDHGRCYFSMRKAGGRTLAELIEEAAAGTVHRSLATVADRLTIIERVCEAVAYAHSRGVVHRDLKPGNIMLGDYGEVLVLDWGTARDMLLTDTEPSKLIGTPAYMSPEQARAEPADERSDVYCLGATLFNLLTLKRPFSASDGPEAFWERRRAGALPDVPPELPSSLSEIILRAMASDPADRFESAMALRSALQNYERNQASIALCERTERALEAAEKDGDYARFSSITESFERALEQWPDNERAWQGLSRARASHARFALTQGDIELAASVLDPGDPAHAELWHAVDEARARARSARRKVVGWRVATAVVAVVAAVALVLVIADLRSSVGAWRMVYEFVPGRTALEQLKIALPQRQLAVRPVIEHGALVLPPTELYFLDGVTASGNVRMEAEVEWEDKVDGFEVVLKAPPGDPPSPWDLPPGYVAQFGGYSGAVSFIWENRTSGQPKSWDGVAVEFEPGRRYRLSFTVTHGEAVIAVDGNEQHRTRLALPLGDATYQRVGIRSWGRTKLHRLAVSQQTFPKKPDPLLVGDVLVSLGHLADAVSVYERIANESPGTSTEEEALARAYLAAKLLPDSGDDRERILGRLMNGFPKSPHLEPCLAAAAQFDWSRGRHDRALERADQVLSRYPTSRVALALAADLPQALPRGSAAALLRLIGRTTAVSRLDISGMQIESLEALRGKRLVELVAQFVPLRDLGPLRGMPLQRIDLSGTTVSDLSPLATTTKLEQLGLSHTPVADIAPLRGLPLTRLHLRDTQVSDLTPLRGAPLRMLDVSETRVADLAPLRDMRLQVLRCSHTRVKDISALAGQPIEELSMAALGVADLSALRGMPLTSLEAHGNAVRDLAPAGPWSGRWWRLLNLSVNAISDLGPLAGTSGHALDVAANPLSDVSPLETSQWQSINISNTQVRDLSPLAKTALDRLNMVELPAVSIGPLRESVRFLDAGGTPIVDLDILPSFIKLDGARLGGTAPPARLLTLAQELAKRQAPSPLVEAIRTVAAFDSRDKSALQALAVPAGDRRYLYIPYSVRRSDASDLASLGGELIPMIDEQVQAALLSQLPDHAHFWVDASYRDGTLRWRDGSAIRGLQVEFESYARRQEATAWFVQRHGSELHLKAAVGMSAVEWADVVVAFPR